MHGNSHICISRAPSHVDRHKNECQIRTRRLVRMESKWTYLVSYIREIFQTGIYSRACTHSRVDLVNKTTIAKCRNKTTIFWTVLEWALPKLAEILKVNSQEELISAWVNNEKFAKRKKVKQYNSKRYTERKAKMWFNNSSTIWL